VGILARRINARLGNGELSGALADLNAAIALAPDEINLIAQRASVAHALKLWDVALADYDTAIAARPDAKDLATKRQAAHAASLELARDHAAHDS
jgi:regulator of sirC expression with transglutaminase-like and TPR domain